MITFVHFFILETPGHGSGWAETPRTDRGGDSIGETPTPGASKRKSRWDETPASQMGGSTPLLTPSGITPKGTPAMAMATPTPGKLFVLYRKYSYLVYIRRISIQCYILSLVMFECSLISSDRLLVLYQMISFILSVEYGEEEGNIEVCVVLILDNVHFHSKVKIV